MPRSPVSVRSLIAVLAAIGAMTSVACATRQFPAPIPRVPGTPRVAFSLETLELREGSGPAMRPRACVYAHYTGWLTDGTKFDSSRDTMPNGQPRSPIVFPQGARRVVAGWDAGFEGMRVGGQRRLIIPYQLAYGETGRPPVIPARATLVFDVELLAVADTLATPPAGTPPAPGPPGPQCPPWSAVQARLRTAEARPTAGRRA